MQNYSLNLKDLYVNKPECAIHFPEWMLSGKKIDEYRSLSRLAIAEIAGRDSIAAAVKGVSEGLFTDLLPTYVYTGTEYGSWGIVEAAVERLANRLPETRVHNLVVLGSPGFWRALNGRFINEMTSKYGFYSPCIGCHLYLHSVRIPLAHILGNVPIISGERERHNGSVKANQIPEALDHYQGLSAEFGISLIFPIRHIAESRHITNLIGFEWEEGKEQLNCVLSGNYRQPDGAVNAPASKISRFMEKFARPCASKIIDSYLANRIPDHIGIASRILGSN